MRDDRIPRGLALLLRRFEVCFTDASLENFVDIVVGWVLCVGRRTVSRVVTSSGALRRRHLSSVYRFLSRAAWSPDLYTVFENQCLHSDYEVVLDKAGVPTSTDWDGTLMKSVFVIAPLGGEYDCHWVQDIPQHIAEASPNIQSTLKSKTEVVDRPSNEEPGDA